MKIDWQKRAQSLHKRVQGEYFEGDRVSTLRMALEETYEDGCKRYRVAVICLALVALPTIGWLIAKFILN